MRNADRAQDLLLSIRKQREHTRGLIQQNLEKLVRLVTRHANFSWNAGHHLRANSDPSSVNVMPSDVEFRTGDLAEVLSGPFRRRLSVILRRYEESELWLVAIYYPSENCFIHTYLNEQRLKIIGHLEGD